MTAMRFPLQELRAFFDDSKIGSERCVVNLIEAEVLESCHNSSGGNLSGFHAEALAQSNAHGRRNLHDHLLRWIRKQIPNLIDLRLDRQRTSGTYAGALSTVDAFDVTKLFTESGLHADLIPAMRKIDCPNALNLRAHAHAVAAEHALVRIANQRRRRFVERNLFVH